MRKTLIAILAVASGGAAAFFVVSAVSSARPKNLILICMDTVRADHLGCYGYTRPTSPRLDAYAKTGALFLNCTSSSSWTTPAILTMLTSMEPATHGCTYYKNAGRLNSGYETLAKILTRNGFRTAAYTGGGFAGSHHGVDIGFESFDEEGRRFETKMKKARTWVYENRDQPFFLFLHGYNAHRPYVPPPKYGRRFADAYTGSYNVREFGPDWPQPSPTDLKYVISQYDGEIACIDDVLGDFLDDLGERGILDDTLVIITTDHGDEFYEHGGCDHKHTLYDELTLAAWIMFGPSVAPITVQEHVGTIDFLPTILDLFNIKTDVAFQGTNRVNLLTGRRTDEDTPIFSYTGRQAETGPRYHFSSVRTDKWKLVTDLPIGVNELCEKCARGEPEGKDVKLFDLKADPGEQTNVADNHPGVVQDLFDQITSRLAQCKKLRLGVEQPPPVTPEYIEGLRALGYIGATEEYDGD